MINKVIDAIKKGMLLQILESRLRIVFRISNKNVYAAYRKQKEYDRLYKKYRKIIDKGVDSLPEHKFTKNIWVCWLQGEDNAPDLVKTCIFSIRNSFPGYRVNVLTTSNIDDFVTLPNHIVKKKEQGIIPFAQYTDILRTALLCKYGGIWIDSTVLCTCKSVPDYVENVELFVYKQFDLEQKDTVPIELSNWFIAAKSNNDILRLTLNLLYKYWEEHNHLTHYFIYHLFFSMAARKYQEQWSEVPAFNNHSPHTLQFEIGTKFSEKRWKQILKISDFHKLNRRKNFSDLEDSFYNYIIKTYKDDK